MGLKYAAKKTLQAVTFGKYKGPTVAEHTAHYFKKGVKEGAKKYGDVKFADAKKKTPELPQEVRAETVPS